MLEAKNKFISEKKLLSSLSNETDFIDNPNISKNAEKIISKGKTEAFLQSKYKISSEDMVYLIKENNLSSLKKNKN